MNEAVQYWVGVSQGLVGNLLTIPVLVAAGFAWVWMRFGALRSFFGIQSDRQIVIYTSTLMVVPSGSVGSDGLPRTYGGPATPINEARLVGRLLSLFEGPIPDLAGLGRPLNSLFVRPNQCTHSESYGQPIPGQESSFITFGSPGYNDVSGAVQVSPRTLAGFDNQNASMVFSDGSTDTASNRGFIYRFFDPLTGQVGFYVAGLSTLGTTAAGSHLIRHWKAMRKRGKNKAEACWIVEATGNDPEQTNVTRVITP